MILWAGREGPDHTDLGFRCPHMSEDTFLHGIAHTFAEIWKGSVKYLSLCVILLQKSLTE